MSELTFTLLRLGFLGLLWLAVLGALLVMRRDIYGTVISARGLGLGGRQGRDKAKGAGRAKAAAKSAQWNILVTEGPLTGMSLPMGDQPIVIGRAATCTLVLEDDYASAQHARIYPQNGKWWVEDLGSTNGTMVGVTRISRPTRLDVGVSVRIGQTVLELRK